MSNSAGTMEGTDCVTEPGKGGRISPFPWQQATRSVQLTPPQQHPAPPGLDRAAPGLSCHPFTSADLSFSGCLAQLNNMMPSEVLIPHTGTD